MAYETLQRRFRELYDTEPTFVVRAPGRVNLIGEHTDYNDGFVFPAALDFEVVIAGAPRRDRQVRAFSLTFNEFDTFSLDGFERTQTAKWSNYVRGVARILTDEGNPLTGMNIAIEGTVPISSGLSSSAAIEVASCLAYEAAGAFAVDPVKRALIAQRAEREFVGVQCGIMDQFISSLGRRAHALFIDTRTLEYEAIPLPAEGVAIVVSDTNKPRELVDSKYNERRSECERAVEILKHDLPAITALRDVTEEQLSALEDKLPEPVRRRARHVVTEDARVLKSITALKAGDIGAFGRLMDASHDSLRDDYEVSCPELDAMVEAARTVPGVYGARMTGAGFGGCTVSLVASAAVEAFQRTVGPAYARATNLKATFYICRASDGAERVV